MKTRGKLWAAIVTVAALLFAGACTASAADTTVTLFSNTVPKNVADPDTASVTLGVRVKPSVTGQITGLRFYKSVANTGTHTGGLYTTGGTKLGSLTFTGETASGWQDATFTTPVTVKAGTTYVAAYLAPKGRYAGDNGGFTNSYTAGPLTVPAHGGVYHYGSKLALPKNTWQSSNYFVDVDFVPGSDVPPVVTPPVVDPPTTPPTTDPTPPPTTDPTPPPTTDPTPPVDPGTPIADLPRIAWEGGPAYWSQFGATKGKWDNPGFFPIGVWYDTYSNDAEVKYDKSVGINFYTGGLPTGTPQNLLTPNNMYWAGFDVSGWNKADPSWVGDFLDDEVDGTHAPQAGIDYLKGLIGGNKGDGKFQYTNFTQQVISNDFNHWGSDFVNVGTDSVSLDMYWYTIPFCSDSPYRENYVDSIPQATCRTAHSYGRSMDMLRQQDAKDGKLQAIWQFVENFNGGPGAPTPARYISPEQMKGSVMDSIINEARGIVYFNQSFSGSCQTSNVVRTAQVSPNSCVAANVAAMKTVDSQIQALAPVINTQSYKWSFGSGLDTMLKSYQGSAYVFAMTDGTTGSRTFTLPAGVTGDTVTVLNEDRTIPVVGGKFVDGFASENTYHIYKITQ